MKKADMIGTIEGRLKELKETASNCIHLMDEDLDKMGKTFEEALNDESIYPNIWFRVWAGKKDVIYELETILELIK